MCRVIICGQLTLTVESVVNLLEHAIAAMPMVPLHIVIAGYVEQVVNVC